MPERKAAEHRLGETEPTAVCDRLLADGPGRLSHAELVQVLLGPGGTESARVRLARRLLRRHGLGGLVDLPPRTLTRKEGLAPGRASRLAAAFELARRVHRPDLLARRPTVSGPRQAFDCVRRLEHARKEHLVGLYLDAQNGLLHRETISIGSLNTTRTHPREILYPAVTHLALGFILAHNHPSGCLEPSEEDVEFTHGVWRAGELMGIELYDHLIVGRGGYTSLRERGLI